VVATGYGRHLVEAERLGRVVSEIKACAYGARWLRPDCRTVIDVGGQDAKAIEVTPEGFAAFEMNDRCAAGTGRFFEVMAGLLDYELETFWREAQAASSPPRHQQHVYRFRRIRGGLAGGRRRGSAGDCARIARGRSRPPIYIGLARGRPDPGIVCRPGSPATAVSPSCCGRLNCPLVVPEHPQLVSAIGAAVLAAGT